MNKKGLLYLLDPELTPGKLRKLKDIPDLDYSKIQHNLDKNKIKFIIEGENDYNYKLTLIKSKPYIIYYKGNIDILNKKLLGIVGPRDSSIYGQKVLEKLFEELKGMDICTITGMAPGIDTLVHQLSIKNKIPTIAALGGGILYYQNRVERYLMQSIVDNGGLILSEFRIDFEPTKYSFPQRNRIIAGLCDLLFLPEAGLKSGSLITADFAFDMNKKVYGTPNGIFDDISAGLNDYIKKGKIIAVDNISKFVKQNFNKNSSKNSKTEDIKNNKNIENIENIENNNIMSISEQKIIKIISKQSECSSTELSQKLGLNFGELMIALSNLEMKGLIYEYFPGIYKKN